MANHSLAGKKSPEFGLPDQDGKETRLSDYSGKWVVLYFYPKDDTTGCTIEAKDFTARIDEFERLGAAVLGVSPDNGKAHCDFRDKYKLRHRLLSDEGHGVLEKYGAGGKKTMYGKEYMGVIRSTFLIDPKGRVAFAWQPVEVNGHAKMVKEKLEELKLRGLKPLVSNK